MSEPRSKWFLSVGVQAQEGHTRASPESGASLEEVIVTAQRREESLQSVPVAVSAFSGEDLQKLGASNNEDLNLVVPGLNIQDRGGIVQPMIRGVGSTANVAGLESAVATYVYGAYNPVSWGGQFRFFDISASRCCAVRREPCSAATRPVD